MHELIPPAAAEVAAAAAVAAADQPHAAPVIKKRAAGAAAAAADDDAAAVRRRSLAVAAQAANGAADATAAAEDGALIMEAIVDKLALLDYEAGFLRNSSERKNTMRPLTRTEFVRRKTGNNNSSEQFGYFSSLAAWLLGRIKRQQQQSSSLLLWEQFDDPNVIVSTLASEVKRLGFRGDTTARELRTGCGSAVLHTLDFLCDVLLKRSAFRFSAVPQYSATTTATAFNNSAAAAAAAAMGSDSDDDAVEEADDGDDDDDDDDEDIIDAASEADVAATDDDFYRTAFDDVHAQEETSSSTSSAAAAAAVPQCSAAEWRSHYESVVHRRRLPIKQATDATAASSSTWQVHDVLSRTHSTRLAAARTRIKAALPVLETRVRAPLTRIARAEARFHTTADLVALRDEFVSRSVDNNCLLARHSATSEHIATLCAELENVSDSVDAKRAGVQLKHERLTGGGDGSVGSRSGVRQLLAAIDVLKRQNTAMGIRIGVCSQALRTLQAGQAPP
jgi:hypothetical protein